MDLDAGIETIVSDTAPTEWGKGLLPLARREAARDLLKVVAKFDDSRRFVAVCIAGFQGGVAELEKESETWKDLTADIDKCRSKLAVCNLIQTMYNKVIAGKGKMVKEALAKLKKGCIKSNLIREVANSMSG